MSVYLGHQGQIELQRVSSDRWLYSELAPSDVNVSRKRFSVEFATGALVTGDLVTIATVDGTTLELVDSHVFPDWSGFIHVDEIGGIRLYQSFADALGNITSNALQLVQPTTTKQIKIQTQSDRFRCLAQVTSFDMTTSRELVSTTSLCQEFQNQYEAGLISGQGRMSCFWQHLYKQCDDMVSGLGAESLEFSVYLARLVLRLQQGAKFRGRFYIYKDDSTSDSVWYECDCVVSSVQVAVEPTQLITTEIDFVTTGPIQLRQQSEVNYILQEDASKILLESNQDGALVQEFLD
jgi:hypothetical protein|tara:strand:- start:926 stop:1804 length:879 start_codon:yes stop_codon:yes gene_type:complete